MHLFYLHATCANISSHLIELFSSDVSKSGHFPVFWSSSYVRAEGFLEHVGYVPQLGFILQLLLHMWKTQWKTLT